MDKENLVEKCRRVSVVLTPLKNSEINKWRNQRKSSEKTRRNRWQKGLFKRSKKPQGRKLSVTSSNVDENCSKLRKTGTACGIAAKQVMVEREKAIRTDDTRDTSPPAESDESFPAWKYKRKRFTRVSSSDDEPSAKRVEKGSCDMNLSGKELHINLKRLTAADKSSADTRLNNAVESELEQDFNDERASLIMDSCDSHDTIGVDAGIDKDMTPGGHESQEADEADDLGQSKDSESFAESNISSDNMNGAPSDEDNESEGDDDEELTELCLMKETTVLVTKLEDVIECLEDNRTFPDLRHLTREHLNIIRGFRQFLDTSDDTSYTLVMSPDAEPLLEGSTDTDEAFNSHVSRMRNRRRISSDGSSGSAADLSIAEDQVPGDLEAVAEEPAPSGDEEPSEFQSPSKSSHTSSSGTMNDANEPEGSIHSEETLFASPLSCSGCKKSFRTMNDKVNHLCAPKSKKEKTKSKNKASKQKKSTRMAPKSTSTNCHVCSEKFESHEQLSEHIFKHTPKELQEAYMAAARDRGDSQPQLDIDSDPDDCVEIPSSERTNPGVAIMTQKSVKGKVKKKIPLPVNICPCHTDCLESIDPTVQIEMVLFCEVCKVLFRRSECLETHYRSNAECNKNRKRGRSAKFFCRTCRFVLNTLPDMRTHLVKHVNQNRNQTVTFVCNICRVVFFGVGTVFCTHWFNHEHNPMFVASKYSFPKLSVSNRGKSPLGKRSGEQYYFVAEYVCKSCKQQFSSESDLAGHECKGVEVKPAEESKGAPAARGKKKSVKIVTVVAGSSKEIAQGTASRKSWALPAENPSEAPVEPPKEKPVDPPKEKPVELPKKTPVEPPKKTPIEPPKKTPPNIPILPSPRPPQPPLQILPQPAPEVDTSGSYVKTWICDICEETFPTRRALLVSHAANHFDSTVALERFNSSVERPYACTICRIAYGSINELTKHWLTHELMRYLCSACNETYYTIQAFTRHVIIQCRKHNPVCRVSFGTKGTCKLCKIAFKEVDDLTRHNIDYHGAGRIVGTRSGVNSSQKSQPIAPASQESGKSAPTKNPPVSVVQARSHKNPQKTVAPASQESGALAPMKNPPVPLVVARHLPPIAPKSPAARVASPQNPPIVLCVQSPSANELVTTNQPLVINIAIPNIVQANPSDETQKTVSPPKVRALEDPTVQVVLTQTNSSDSTLSASLVTGLSPMRAVTSSRGLNASTFALTVRDTTTAGGSVTEKDSTQEESVAPSILTSLLQNSPLIPDSSAPGNDSTETNNLAADDLPENGITNSSDDIEILEVMKKTKEKSVEKPSPKKSRAPEAADSDVEILSEASAPEEPAKLPEDDPPPEKAEETPEKPESPETTKRTLLKNPLSKPQGFLRVKNLSELQDENKNVNKSQETNKTRNTLTEHLMAHLKESKSPTKQQTSSNGTNSGESAASVSTLIPGRRILPNIPQRLQGDNSRRASPLTSGMKPMNRVTPIPTSNAGMSMNAHCSRTPQYLVPSSVEDSIIYTMGNPLATNQMFTCPICPSSFHRSISDYLGHLAQHPNLPPRVQPLIDKFLRGEFPSVNQLQQMQTRGAYRCLLCSNFETDSAADFRKHFLTHSQQTIASIQAPAMGFQQFGGGQMNTLYSLDYGYQAPNLSSISGHPQLFRCSLCVNYQFATYEELEKHVETMHGIIRGISDRFVCALCPNLRVFADERTLRDHQKTQHTFVCSICLQMFTSAYELNTHCDLHKNGQLGNPYSNNG